MNSICLIMPLDLARCLPTWCCQRLGNCRWLFTWHKSWHVCLESEDVCGVFYPHLISRRHHNQSQLRRPPNGLRSYQTTWLQQAMYPCSCMGTAIIQAARMRHCHMSISMTLCLGLSCLCAAVVPWLQAPGKERHGTGQAGTGSGAGPYEPLATTHT